MNRDNNSRVVWTSDSGRVGDKKEQRGKGKKNKKGGANLASTGFPKDGVIRVRRETGGRGGKTVTVLYGTPGPDAARKDLLKELKQLCGCGGAVKEGRIEIKGDHRDKILAALADKGMDAKAAGG